MENDNVILEKSFQFAKIIIQLHTKLTNNKCPYSLRDQILRSGTSIGANCFEAVKGQSNADFYAKFSIALKEANETYYWLKLLTETGYIQTSEYKELESSIREIIAIITAICRTTYNKNS